MNMTFYNVVVRTNLDELPICIKTNKQDAIDAIGGLSIGDIEKSADLMKVDYAGLVNAAIITYGDGIPLELELFDLPESVTTAETAEL